MSHCKRNCSFIYKWIKPGWTCAEFGSRGTDLNLEDIFLTCDALCEWEWQLIGAERRFNDAVHIDFVRSDSSIAECARSHPLDRDVLQVHRPDDNMSQTVTEFEYRLQRVLTLLLVWPATPTNLMRVWPTWCTTNIGLMCRTEWHTN